MTMRILLRDAEKGRWMDLDRPRKVVSVDRIGEVVDALHEIEESVEKEDLTAAGFVAYEAAPAFDPAFQVGPPTDDCPLVSFGLFESPVLRDRLPFGDLGPFSLGEWKASQTEAEYGESIRRIRDHIARGDTYQVNHTFRLQARFGGDPRALFRALVGAQPDSLAAYLEVGELAICSASPELLFQLDGERVLSRPMKGTADRGHSTTSDRERMDWLGRSLKNRAENTMIVDMVRNDLGRVARPGTVDVTSRFEVERHPTVFQMTSTVEAETSAPVSEILAALFPFASVTGAPKIRTMGLIRELESTPRGVYTGAIGFMAPGRRARFSVGIRTAVVDRTAEAVVYGVGSGVVWDSVAGDEHRECVAKARILSHPAPEFDLLETMLWEPGDGFFLLERHLDRLAEGAEYFRRPVDRETVRRDLHRREAGFGDRRRRVRLLLAPDGSHRIETTPLDSDSGTEPIRVGLAKRPVRSDDPFLHFKTTHREVYEAARRSRPDCEDVLLWNERGEVTESTIANIVAVIGGRKVSPPVASGLLAGTFRAELLARGEVSEGVIRVEDLSEAEELFLINSVQGWRDAVWVDG